MVTFGNKNRKFDVDINVQPEEIFKGLLKIGQEECFENITQIPGSGVHKHVCDIVSKHREKMLEFFINLSLVEKLAFIKAIAVYEESVQGVGSITSLREFFRNTPEIYIEALDWVLKNTNSYWYYSNGAKSYSDYCLIQQNKEKYRAESLRIEDEIKRAAKERRGIKATSNLYNAVRRGDLKAVRALIAKGADREVKAPDGTSLIELAKANNHNDIADVLSEGS